MTESTDIGGWQGFLQRWRAWLVPLVLAGLGWLLYAALRDLLVEIDYADVVAAVRATPMSHILLAVFATAVSFAALAGYDHAALRFAGAKVPPRMIFQTSFVAYALSNTVGLGFFTGGSVRMRMYNAVGVEAGQVARAVVFQTTSFAIGITLVGAAAMLWSAEIVDDVVNVPSELLQLASVAILAGGAWLIGRCGSGEPLHLPGGRVVTLPTQAVALEQLVFSVIDIVAAAATLWLFLPAGSVNFLPFLSFFAIATVLGVLSNVPGGLGVFEAVMLVALNDDVSPDDLASALVLYRVIYYLLPLVLALGLLVRQELRRGVPAPVADAAAGLAPLFLAAYTMVAGFILLVSGVTPATHEATRLLARYVPLPVVELSHFIGSVAGLALLFVARGMLDRLDAAWWAGVGLAMLSLLTALPKGVAVSEVVMLGVLIIALALSREQFTRRASLLAQPFTLTWLFGVAVILGAVTALLFFAYRDVDYAQELWWQFEFDGHVSRSLRALVGVALVAFVIALRQLLRPPAPPLARPGTAEIERAAEIVAAQSSPEAFLALTGDKHFLFSESGNAFLMFGRQRRSRVALFDPVGPASESQELVWRFLEEAREAGDRASFYQVTPAHLPVYLDAGLQLYKLGEYAYVPLADFSLKGRSRANLRQGVNRAERDGLAFEVVEPADVPRVLPELRAISDAWLGEHRTAEKGFSLGLFRDEYVRRQPVAIVRHEGRAVAFATLLVTGVHADASVDLMRQLPDAPRSAMDFLFARLMLHFQALGYRRFGLGMAPLSGMAEHPLAPNWHRVGRLLYAHGENFYNFQGLRAFKEKFDPQWEPRYLASPGGVAPLIVLTDIAALVSGGLKGVIGK